MSEINLGEIILLIAALGYVSNFLNWRYLNYGVIRLLYYIGAVVHETSHAILCLLTGARIEKFTVFSSQPQVVHQKSKLPLLGEPLISFAPIAGGLLFLFLVNHYLLGNHFAASVPQFSSWHDWQSMLLAPLKLIAQINGLQWQSWVMILLFFNVGAMLGPSPRDLKNVWPALIVLFFVPVFWATQPLIVMGLMALDLILVNIVLQIIAIGCKSLFTWRKISLLLVVIVIIAAALLFYEFHHPQEKGSAPSSQRSGINCFQSPEYFVIDNNPGLPGLDIVAKHKTNIDEAIPCVAPATAPVTVASAPSDVVVRNDLPEFILGLTEHFLIIDSGTAPPPRGLIVYDLDVRTSTYADTYSPPIAIATGTVTYWASTKQIVTKTNCLDIGQYTADGLGVVIESHVVLNLSTLSKKELGEYRCEPTQ